MALSELLLPEAHTTFYSRFLDKPRATTCLLEKPWDIPKTVPIKVVLGAVNGVANSPQNDSRSTSFPLVTIVEVPKLLVRVRYVFYICMNLVSGAKTTTRKGDMQPAR